MIDSHAHLDDPSFESDRNEVIQRARDTGVEQIITVGCDLETSRSAVELADRHHLIYATVGIHPHEAKTADNSTYAELRRIAAHPKVVAWGEIGLDYHYLNSTKEVQLDVFRQQIRLAKEIGLPIVIHMREAQDDTLTVLQEEGAEKMGGVFHCFSGDLSAVRTALGMNFMISISGVITFPKAHQLQEMARQIPLEHLMIETDSPYLTPVPYRGKRNEPAYVQYIARKLADLKSCSYEEIVRMTSMNTQRLFRNKEMNSLAST